MSEHEINSWKHVRACGKKRFILKGLLQRGFRCTAPFAAVFLLILLAVGIITHHVSDLFAERKTVVETVALYVLLTLLIGWGEGADQWFKNEQSYRRLEGHARK